MTEREAYEIIDRVPRTAAIQDRETLEIKVVHQDDLKSFWLRGGTYRLLGVGLTIGEGR